MIGIQIGDKVRFKNEKELYYYFDFDTESEDNNVFNVYEIYQSSSDSNYRNFRIGKTRNGRTWIPSDRIELVSSDSERYEPGQLVKINVNKELAERSDYNYWVKDEFNLYSLADTVVKIISPMVGAGMQLYLTDRGLIPYNIIVGKWEGERPQVVRLSCSRCGCMYTLTKEEYEELFEEDKDLCLECRKRLYVTPYHRYQPHLSFYKCDEDDDLFLGTEIEIDCGGESNYIAGDIVKRMNPRYSEGEFFMWCSHDGSLNDGLEMITAPATLNYHLSQESQYKNLFKWLLSAGYRSHNTTTSGIHVHFSRSFYAENEEDNISKLLYLVEKFWNELVIFSRRDYRTLERYAKKTDDDINEFVDRWNKSETHDGHYYAVNISNKNTIELRMFRGTLNTESFMCILELVDKLVRTAKNKTINELQALTFNEVLTPRAKQYYESRIAVSKYEE